MVPLDHVKTHHVSQVQSLTFLSDGLDYGSRILDDFREEASKL